MIFSRLRYWVVLFVLLMIGLIGCSEFPTEPSASTSDDAVTSPDSEATSDTSADESQSNGDGAGENEDSGDTSGYCDGSELLCLPSMASEYIAQYNGDMVGGTLSNGEFTPSSTGGIKFPLSIDASQKLKIEFEIEGNIPNWNRSENGGGKVSLFTMQENGGTYYLSLQRMDQEYRGGGIFRVILGDRDDMRTDGAAWLITHRDLAGDYSMKDWGSERHQFEVIAQGDTCRLYIDSYRSRSISAPYGISGHRNVTFVLGNRETSRMFLGEAALTRFQRVRITYE